MKQKKNRIIKNKTKLPQGVSEDEFLAAIDNICKKLVYKFKFGYHSIEDMKQQSIVFALEGLKNYDPKRPLENFLWTHIHNRLFNFKRDNYQRPDKPCTSCIFFDKACKYSQNQCKEYENKYDCELYLAWEKRNNSKKNILSPSNIENNSVINPKMPSPENSVYFKEIDTLINENLPIKYREFYLKLKNGCKLKKLELIQLQDQIKIIMSNFFYFIFNPISR